MEKNRLSRVREAMRAQGLQQILVTSTASVYYLTGLWVEPHERMLALYLDLDGQPTLFANEIFGLLSTPDLPVVAHRDGTDPVADLAAAVRAGALGIDKFYPSKFLIGILEKRPDVRPVHGSGPVDLTRMFKDEAEIAAMIHSSQMNDQVMAEILPRVRAGVRENELASQVNHLYLERGADQEGTQLVCFGPNCADPHHAGDGTAIRSGDSVIFDIFTPISRYWCDMTRTVFFGGITEKQRRVYELVREANAAAEAAVAPGIMLSELDDIARGIITAGGFGACFTHRLGHGCGIECHEPPDVSGMSETPVQEGMVFSIEPGIYLPGEFGVRIEDLVLVTKTGCRVLNAYPKDLTVLG